MPEPLDDALAALRPLLLDQEQLVRAVAAGRRKGQSPLWRRIELRPVDLKAGRQLQVIEFDASQAHTQNVAFEAAATAVDGLLAQPFGTWYVETLTETIQLRVTKKGDAQIHRAISSSPKAVQPHDRPKARLLALTEPFLAELGLTDADAQIKPSRFDKVRQVEELLRALEVTLPSAPVGPLNVVDLGCGNGYLTFATYWFLTSRGYAATVTGVDVKAQSREHGTALATKLGWADVTFVEGSAGSTEFAARPEVVLALHACDTATDEALARAVQWGSQLVLAAPCCHHDLQRQLGQRAVSSAPEPYGLLTRHGILRERFTDVLTDALRASLLRILGYRVEVVEFVGSEHTPRNTLIRAVYTGARPTADQVREYQAMTAAWGVVPRLQSLLANECADVFG